MDEQCEAITAAGTRCSRVGKHRNQCGEQVCQQHLWGIHKVISIKDVEPWVHRNMPEPALHLLRASVVQKLRRKLKQGPRPVTPRGIGRGRGGSIYVYCLENDDHLNLYKVGMTCENVDKRLQQWERKHKCKVRQVAQYVTLQDVAWVERVIHLYLDYCRVYRYPLLKGGLHSVWAATGEPLTTSTTTEDEASAKRPLVVTEKMVEWFKASFDDIDAVISQVH